jgi:hypothetical protein
MVHSYDSQEYFAQEFANYVSLNPRYSHIRRNLNYGLRAKHSGNQVSFSMSGVECRVLFNEGSRVALEMSSQSKGLSERTFKFNPVKTVRGKVSGNYLRDFFEGRIVRGINDYVSGSSKDPE